MHILDTLKERGFIAQVTFEDDLYKALEREPMTFYVGFDPTADSLHVGHYIPIMAMAHLQRAGHRPIALCGGGTAMIGDPSGKSDMRKMMSRETIAQNVLGIQKQLSRFLDFSDGKALMVNNGDWLLNLNYIDFLREVGALFSVNRMLTAECYRRRLETGLTFLEFNYMLMQSYDFMVMARDIDCRMQFGGNDQWSNILGGVELTRKMCDKQVYGMTFSLLTTSEGVKMGKTQKGALWLDAEKTPPYEFYQYWRNVADADVEKCLRMLTFLPMDEVKRLSSLKDQEINKAKEVLAYEVTKLVHGEEEAEKAQQAARAAFGGGDLSSMPTVQMERSKLDGEGMGVVNFIKELGLIPSNREGFMTIEQGGLRLDGEKVEDKKLMVTADMFSDGKLLVEKGKKKKVVVELV